jgi:hypothetical protein
MYSCNLVHKILIGVLYSFVKLNCNLFYKLDYIYRTHEKFIYDFM